MTKFITLTPVHTSEEVRVGTGRILRDARGIAVRGDVTWQDYDKVASLEDGTTGILRKMESRLMSSTTYWLEVKEQS